MDHPIEYTAAIAEFEKMDKNHRDDFIFSFIGYALYLTQTTEKLLMNVIWADIVVNNKSETSKELNLFFDTYEFGKHTMGILIKEVNKILNLPTDEEKKLKDVLDQRNYLVHNYFKVNESLLHAKDGYNIIIRDFINYINSANEIEKILQVYLFQYLEKVGYSKEMIQRKIDEEVEKWKQTRIDNSYQSIPS